MHKTITRKEFLKTLGAGACGLFLANRGFCPLAWAGDGDESIRGKIFKNDAPKKPWKWSIEAFHYKKDGENVRCLLCPNACYLSPGDRGVCRSRGKYRGKALLPLLRRSVFRECRSHRKKNPSSISTRAIRSSPWPWRDAISGVSIARTGKSPRGDRRTCSIMTSFQRM